MEYILTNHEKEQNRKALIICSKVNSLILSVEGFVFGLIQVNLWFTLGITQTPNYKFIFGSVNKRRIGMTVLYSSQKPF